MICAALYWDDNGSDNIDLRYFTFNHIVFLYNCLTIGSTGFYLIELANKSKTDHCYIILTHVWVCSVFVLEPKPQDVKRIIKWNWCPKMCQFTVLLSDFSSLVALIINLNTGYVIILYHLVFKYLFQTVFRFKS